MRMGGAPEPFSRVTVGSPIYTQDHYRIGVVKEIRGRALRVGARVWREFWLGAESIATAIPYDSVILSIDRAHLDRYKLKEPPTLA